DPWIARVGRWARRHRTKVVASVVLLVSAVVALSISTALVWAEQQRTAEQKLLAEKSYQVARKLSFNSIAVIELVEADVAAQPTLPAPRKEILTTASGIFRQALEQTPDDPELQRQAAQLYRYTANVHRRTYDVEAAEPLHVDSLRLYEDLARQDPEDTARRQKVAEALREHGSFLLLA